jgi:hypothetical protein
MDRVGAAARVAVLGIVLAVTACGGNDKPTLGSACEQVLSAFCDRLINGCALAPTSAMSSCISAGMAACCSGSGCDAPLSSSQAEIDTCVRAVEIEACTDASNGLMPSPCQGVGLVAEQKPRELNAADPSPAAAIGRQFSQQ